MPLQGDWKWYITIAAVREWMALTGRGGDQDLTRRVDERSDFARRRP
jgi:hypothetical protein